MLAPVRILAPAATPVSLAEIKAHLLIPHNDDDARIATLIAAATDHFDGYAGILGRALVTQTWRQDYDDFRSFLQLPLWPVTSIQSVKYIDTDGVEQAVSPAEYRLRSGISADVAFDAAYSFPPLNRAGAAVSVTYVAGLAAADVPVAIKLAIILHVKMNYDPLKPEERVSYQQAIDVHVSPFRRVGV